MQHVLSLAILCLCSVFLLAVNFGVYRSLQAADKAVGRHVLHVLEATRSQAVEARRSPTVEAVQSSIIKATWSPIMEATRSQAVEAIQNPIIDAMQNPTTKATTSAPTISCSNHSFSVIIVTHNEPLLYKTYGHSRGFTGSVQSVLENTDPSDLHEVGLFTL